MSHRTRLRALVLPALAAAALGIAACGGDDEPPKVAAPPDPPELRQLDEAADAAPAEADKLLDDFRANYRDTVEQQLRASGLSDEQVDCMLPKLEAAVHDRQLEQAMKSGDTSDLMQLGTEVAEECGAKLG